MHGAAFPMPGRGARYVAEETLVDMDVQYHVIDS